MNLILRWLVSAGAVAAAVYLVEGIRMEGDVEEYLGVALILGLINALVRPLLTWISCGVIFLTLGLFLLVINAGMLMLTATIAQTFGLLFTVDGFWAALVGAAIISLVSYIASFLLVNDD